MVTITVGGTPIVKNGANPFYDEWLDSGTTVSYAYEGPITITADVKQYRLVSVTGTSTDQSHNFGAISGAITEAAAYQAQFYITFDQTGVGSDFAGTVVAIDGTGYALAGAYKLPASFARANFEPSIILGTFISPKRARFATVAGQYQYRATVEIGRVAFRNSSRLTSSRLDILHDPE